MKHKQNLEIELPLYDMSTAFNKAVETAQRILLDKELDDDDYWAPGEFDIVFVGVKVNYQKWDNRTTYKFTFSLEHA